MNLGERSMTRSGRRIEAAIRRALALVLTLLAALASPPAFAHDIPADVRIQAFVKPEGQQLLVLLRVPLGAMNEVDMPLRGPGYLDLARADAALRVAAELWFADNLSLFEDDRPLPRPTLAMARVSLASDRSFASWDEAMAHLRAAPIPPQTELYWKAQHFDLLLELPISSDRSRFSIEPRLARMGLKVVTTLRYLPPDGTERAYEFHGNPGRVHLDPRWHQAALRFVEEGFFHILDGTDHLLFIACLVIPFRRLRPLVVIATAFTVAHSLTLAAAVLGLAPEGLWFPPLVEWLIAVSIVAMALENLVGTSSRRRWMAAFVFGLVHGFGFAFALRESLQFAGSHLATALLSFNVGVELGQLAVLVLLVPALNALRRVVPERAMVIVLSVLVAHTAWHWMSERWATLRQFPLPAVDAGTLAGGLRWLMAALAAALAVWAADRFVRRWMGTEEASP
jgi:hypothetical protein